MALKKSQLPSLSADLAQVALVDAATAAAVGGMSVSWWLNQVQGGYAPKPVLRGTRCTRWLSASVASYWRSRAENGPNDVERADRLAARSKKASAASLGARSAASAASAKGQLGLQLGIKEDAARDAVVRVAAAGWLVKLDGAGNNIGYKLSPAAEAQFDGGDTSVGASVGGEPPPHMSTARYPVEGAGTLDAVVLRPAGRIAVTARQVLDAVSRPGLTRDAAARAVGVTRGTFAGAVRRVARAGWLVRGPGQADGYTPSEAARRALEAAGAGGASNGR